MTKFDDPRWSPPCWCDWRCRDPSGCVCIFHGPPGDYDCGSPKTRADIHRVASAFVLRLYHDRDVDAWVMETLDAIDAGQLADTHGLASR